MPGVHKDSTISFRPSEWERILIEERATLSGMAKKDFITKSCIYSNLCVVGTKANVQRIVNAVEEMKYTMESILDSLSTREFPLSEDSFNNMILHYYGVCVSIVDILDGAAYLFGKESRYGSPLKKQERMEQLLESLRTEYPDGDI